ncbi:hypothetical protein LTR53_008265 [Teratosphaeriaceae sp. CCFEE 6253]|nr:hypothetical protein LTR53_008265 [Teratosphaeriaceae sp. CCFEE 6253]
MASSNECINAHELRTMADAYGQHVAELDARILGLSQLSLKIKTLVSSSKAFAQGALIGIQGLMSLTVPLNSLAQYDELIPDYQSLTNALTPDLAPAAPEFLFKCIRARVLIDITIPIDRAYICLAKADFAITSDASNYPTYADGHTNDDRFKAWTKANPVTVYGRYEQLNSAEEGVAVTREAVRVQLKAASVHIEEGLSSLQSDMERLKAKAPEWSLLPQKERRDRVHVEIGVALSTDNLTMLISDVYDEQWRLIGAMMFAEASPEITAALNQLKQVIEHATQLGLLEAAA